MRMIERYLDDFEIGERFAGPAITVASRKRGQSPLFRRYRIKINIL